MPKNFKQSPIQFSDPNFPSGSTARMFWEHGYVLIKATQISNDSFHDRSRWKSHRQYQPIFNNSLDSNTNDNKRSQKYLTKKESCFMNKLGQYAMEKLFGTGGDVVGVVSLLSQPKCKEQLIHSDFPKNSEKNYFLDTKLPPLGLIYAPNNINQEPCKLVVLEKSHICGQDWENLRELRKKEVVIPEGYAMLFHGALLHAGASYTTYNFRFHAFLYPGGNKGRKIPLETEPFKWLSNKKRVKSMIMSNT